MPIQSRFINGPELKFELEEDAHVHESLKYMTEGQMHCRIYLKELMQYNKWTPLSHEDKMKISMHFNVVNPRHPGYLARIFSKRGYITTSTLSDDTMDQKKKATKYLVAITTTKQDKPMNTRHNYERCIFDTGATMNLTNNDRYLFNKRTPNNVIVTAAGIEYPVLSEGELILKSICGAVLSLQ
jgi:hypothetical protein